MMKRAHGQARSLEIAYRPPYDGASLFRFLAARGVEGVERIEASCYARTFDIAGKRGYVEVTQDAPRHRFTATIESPDDDVFPEIESRLRRLFDLDCDPALIANALRRDRTLARLVAARPGLRVPGAFDPFETAVRGILGQQVTVAAATRLAGRLVHEFGRPATASARAIGLTHCFPDANDLARADILARIGMPRARAATINALARAVASDPAFFDSAPGAILGRLRAIRGIGNWTAQYIAMRALGDRDAFPSGDVGVLRALSKGGERPSAREADARSERWRPWRAYAALHLWAADAVSTKGTTRAIRD